VIGRALHCCGTNSRRASVLTSYQPTSPPEYVSTRQSGTRGSASQPTLPNSHQKLWRKRYLGDTSLLIIINRSLPGLRRSASPCVQPPRPAANSPYKPLRSSRHSRHVSRLRRRRESRRHEILAAAAVTYRYQTLLSHLALEG